MAPTKKSRDPAVKNPDKPRRRRRPQDTEQLYKCLGKLCGEECDQELVTVMDSDSNNNNAGKSNSRRSDDIEMDAHTDFSDEEFDDDRQRGSGQNKSGRVSKHKIRKLTGQPTELQIGVQKAKRYICEALDFGVQSGYLTPKDPKGKVLRVSSDLLQSSDSNKKRLLPRAAPETPDPRIERRNARKQVTNETPEFVEERDDGDVEERSRHRRHRSGSRRRGKKSRRSRSRSRSKRRRHGRRRREVRSRSVNQEPEGPPKLVKSGDDEQEVDENCKESNNTSNSNDNDNDETKSMKSVKSESQNNSESQNTNDEKKHDDDNDSTFENSDDEEKK